jgi:hypothetical protein
VQYQINVVNEPPNCVQVQADFSRSKNTWLPMFGLREDHLEPIQNWISAFKLGRRIGPDLWQLNNDVALTIFLMFWHRREFPE